MRESMLTFPKIAYEQMTRFTKGFMDYLEEQQGVEVDGKKS